MNITIPILDDRRHADLQNLFIRAVDMTRSISAVSPLAEEYEPGIALNDGTVTPEALAAMAERVSQYLHDIQRLLSAAGVMNDGRDQLMSAAEPVCGEDDGGPEDRTDAAVSAPHDSQLHGDLWSVAGDLERTLAQLTSAHTFVVSIVSGEKNAGDLAFGADAIMEKALPAFKAQVDRLYDVARSER